MNNLIEEHREFLDKFKILDSLVLNGTGMEKSLIVETMIKDGYLVVVGVDACYQNHSIRKKSWHCVECDPKRLNFQGRFNKKSTVYIAESKISKLIKIGIGENPLERVKQHNYYKYAGISDWTLAVSMQCEAAGRVEYDSHTALSVHKVSDKYYYKNGIKTHSQEVFDCTLLDAKLAVENASGKLFFTNKFKEEKKMIPKVAAFENFKCIETTVALFAAELGLPPSLLISQLKNAGVIKSSLEDCLVESDKTTLLNHLRKEHGSEKIFENKITITRKSNSTFKTKKLIRPYEIVNEKIKSARDRLNALKVNQKLQEADELRNKYFKMDKSQLLDLWNSGNNDFEEDEREIIKIAIKNKSSNT